MNLRPWKLEFKPGWNACFKKFDKSTQQRILKKLAQMTQPLQARGLHASRFQVEEVGQHRIAFIQADVTRTKHIHLVGDHKQYQSWYFSL